MKAITTVSFSADKLRADTDYFMEDMSIASAAALPAAAVDGVRLGNVQSSVEIVVECGVALVTGATSPLVVKLQSCATKDGAFADVAGGTLYTLAISQTPVGIAGTTLARYTMPVVDTDLFYKVVATSAANNSGTISAYQHTVAR